jgi:phosphatidate cytidylyltransferase
LARAEASRRGLNTRILSAVLLAPPVLAILWAGSPWIDGLLLIAGCVMIWEWARMCGARSVGPLEATSIAAVAGAVVVGFVWGAQVGVATVALGALAAGIAAALRRARTAGDGGCGWFAFGIAYVGLPVLAFQWLRGLDAGMLLIFWLILVVWATDIGAYAVGKTLGGPKLWPAVSPNKTWSGGLGGVAMAILVGLAFAWGSGAGDAVFGAALSGLTSIAAQAGDFFESYVKRRFHRKDTSGLIPGHGGLLDRVDGLIGGTLAVAVALVVWESAI